MEQVDFREVLQSKKSSEEQEGGGQQNQEGLKGTLKKSEILNNNLVATKRSRGKEKVQVEVRRENSQAEEVFLEDNFKPEFTQQLKDVNVRN